jgi:hypothetical protein
MGYCWESQKDRRPSCRWVDNTKMELRAVGRAELVRLRVGTSGGLL